MGSVSTIGLLAFNYLGAGLRFLIIREKSEQLKEFAIICNKYRDLVQAFQIGKKDLKNRLIDKKDFNGHVQELCEYLNTHVWFAMGSYMSKDRILSELRGIYDRELPELEEK